jgi:hypothetical protein
MNINTKKEKLVNDIIESMLIYDSNLGIFFHKKSRPRVKINSQAGCLKKDGYVYITIKNIKFRAHRIAWRLYYGKWPNDFLDHINGNRSDNRICNLRESSKRENSLNKERHRCGDLPGFYFDNDIKKFRAVITIKRIKFHLGYFETKVEAHNQYKKALEIIKERKFKNAKELRNYLK